MKVVRPAIHGCALSLALLALTACSGERFGGFDGPGSSASQAPAPPPVNLAGRWLLSSAGRGQCRMTFGAAGPAAVEGTIAPEGGCPGKFYMSRKWTSDPNGITMRDHNGQPLAQLSGDGAQFNGKTTGGEPVTLTR
jgi:hypothetical protein